MAPLRLKHALASSLWLVPLLWVFGGIGLSFATIAIDHEDDIEAALTPDQLGIGSGPDVRAPT